MRIRTGRASEAREGRRGRFYIFRAMPACRRHNPYGHSKDGEPQDASIFLFFFRAPATADREGRASEAGGRAGEAAARATGCVLRCGACAADCAITI